MGNRGLGFHGKDIKIFSAGSNPVMAEEIASHLGLPLGRMKVAQFADGESTVSLSESVRGLDCFIIQSTSNPVNDRLMELLITIDAMKRASAARITAVIPYFGYARQDRKARPRDPISAKLVADILTRAGATRVLTMDLHALQIQGFFDIPVDHLVGAPILARHFMKEIKGSKEDYICVSPDMGSVGRVRAFAKKLGCSMAIVDKRRQKANESEVMNIIGDVSGKKIILVDDLVDTAGTLCNAAKALIEKGGATEVTACATHGVLSPPALERLSESVISKLVLLDTIEQPPEKEHEKIQILNTSEVFATAIRRVYEDIPFNDMYG